jgi:outer membrane protein assembly factor BamA
MTAFSEEQLLDLVPIHPGDIVSRSKVSTSLDQVRNLYQSHGDLNFVCIPNTEFDEAAGTISLEIDVGEGAAFHWGDLHISGMRGN